MKKAIRLFLILFTFLVSLSVVAKEAIFFASDFSQPNIICYSGNNPSYGDSKPKEIFFLQIPHNNNSYIQQLKQKENTPFGNLNNHFITQIALLEIFSSNSYKTYYLAHKPDFIQKSFLSEIHPNAP